MKAKLPCPEVLVLIFIALLGFTVPKKTIPCYRIPMQTFNIWGAMGVPEREYQVTVDSFIVSRLVTYGEYKDYLEAVRRDSSPSFYRSQLPDSTMCTHEAYNAYVNSTEFDNYPVAGVSWDNAMNFCKWRTLVESRGDSLRVIYRLPSCAEWVSANKSLTSAKFDHDFGKMYADWLLESKDDRFYGTKEEMNDISHALGAVCMDKPGDLPADRRKFVIGNSWRISHPSYFACYGLSYYAFQGYSHVGFRYVVRRLKPDIVAANHKRTVLSADDCVLKYWGLKSLKKTIP